MTKIAICHWGLIRSFTDTYQSHLKYIYNVLRDNNIEYDIYLHSWIHPSNKINDYTQFNFKKYQIDDQSEYIKTIDDNISEYWYKEVYEKYGLSLHEITQEGVKNCLYGIESQKRVTQLCLSSGITYDYILYLRPDCELFNNIPYELLNTMNNDSIIVLREYWGGGDGINDIFAITPYNNCMMAFRIDEVKEYRKNIGPIQPEYYNGYISKKYYKNIIYCDLKLKLRRLLEDVNNRSLFYHEC